MRNTQTWRVFEVWLERGTQRKNYFLAYWWPVSHTGRPGTIFAKKLTKTETSPNVRYMRWTDQSGSATPHGGESQDPQSRTQWQVVQTSAGQIRDKRAQQANIQTRVTVPEPNIYFLKQDQMAECKKSILCNAS